MQVHSKLIQQFSKSLFLFLLAVTFLVSYHSLAQGTSEASDAEANKATIEAKAEAPAADAAGGADPQVIAQGESIFKANCAQCHAVHDQVVGPALKGVQSRWPSEAALIGFIKYPQKVIDGGDPYAKKLYEQYKQYMPNHDFLSNAEIKSVLTWVDVESKKGPTVAEVVAVLRVKSCHR